MAARLDLHPNEIIWEPTAGEGHLIDAVLRVVPKARILASEIRPEVARRLEAKYADSARVTVYTEDVLDVEPPIQRTLFAATRPMPTRIIGNPPFGAWQSPDRRAHLRQRFPGIYVRETYSTILFHCLDFLAPGGILVFLVPDTFLWLTRHEGLRRRLFENFCVSEVVRFPAKLFPGVAFGYSAMSVITVRSMRPDGGSVTRLGTVADVDELLDLAKTKPEATSFRAVQQSLLATSPANSFGNVCIAGTGTMSTLGELADVRTGFYSGNDRRWIRRASPEVKRSTGYMDVDVSSIHSKLPAPLRGIAGPCHFIPILRGGAARFVRPTSWYVEWSIDAVSEYTRPGKNPARFQNSSFYFRNGIAVPMVASANLTASLIEGRLFDQGIVGIFPKDESLLFYLLGFLNTRCATSFLRAINATANNSANYLKKIPVPLPTPRELERTSQLVGRAVSAARAGDGLDGWLETLEEEYRRHLSRSTKDI